MGYYSDANMKSTWNSGTGNSGNCNVHITEMETQNFQDQLDVTETILVRVHYSEHVCDLKIS